MVVEFKKLAEETEMIKPTSSLYDTLTKFYDEKAVLAFDDCDELMELLLLQQELIKSEMECQQALNEMFSRV